MSSKDAATLRLMATYPENQKLMGVLCYCADRIDHLSDALRGMLDLSQETEEDCAIGEAAEGVLRRGGRLEAAKHEFPPALAGGQDASNRRKAFLERECLRKDVEIAQLKLTVERVGATEVDWSKLHGDTEAAYIRKRMEQLKNGGEL